MEQPRNSHLDHHHQDNRAAKPTRVIHPFLFAIFPTLALFAHNTGQTFLGEILWPMVVSFVFAAALLAITQRTLRDSHRAGIVVSIFLALVFSYGHLVQAIQWRIGALTITPGYLLLVIPAIVALLAAVRARRSLEPFTRILNVTAIALVMMPLLNIVAADLRPATAQQPELTSELVDRPAFSSTGSASSSDALPDIYYIVFDRYARADTLKEFYGFDNSQFLNGLVQRGFYVASQSRANYLNTAQSLPCSLNMRHITDLSQTVGENSDDMKPLYAMLQDYTVWRFLKARGYQFIHLGSWWQPTRHNKHADRNINLYSLPEFSQILYQTTLLYPLGLKFGICDKNREQWKRVLYKFDQLANIPAMSQPKFVFAHFLLPHDPYVFDQDGRFVTPEDARSKSRRELYVNQLVFTNRKAIEAIDHILTRSARPPIIVVQADEGPFPLNRPQEEYQSPTFDWRTLTRAEWNQKMRILNAYHLPGVDSSALYPSITPVNSFRLIFNIYFQTKFELLPDESYAFVDARHIYKFFNVTKEVD
ncbi:MAG: LTA synthase family protein [Blastocatellia bacterium]|nr:LTA synthase family protein [Blastocatellia bacterium]